MVERAVIEEPGGGELAALLDAGLLALGDVVAGALDAGGRARLLQLVGLLARWNRAFNLTAVREPAEMVSRHLLDSLAVLPWVLEGPVLDLGTGAGFPGLPLAIARPGLAFTLLDSNGKKTRFVRQAVLELGLENVEVVQARLEAYRPGRKFATITARALAALPVLIAGARPLAASNSQLLALKGPTVVEELAGVDERALQCHPLAIPGVDGERILIEVELGEHSYG